MARVIDWRAVLTKARVPFVERGANVGKGEINIRCPFCGPADPSHHMGLNLTSGFWSCWRNSKHNGKSPMRLLMALLKVPYSQARQMAGLPEDLGPDAEGFDAVAAGLLGVDGVLRGDVVPRPRFLRWPRGVAPIQPQGPSWRHWRYLRDVRGFGEHTASLVGEYDLRFCSEPGDDFRALRDRILIPYKMGGKLVAWTGRSIVQTPIRYRDLEEQHCILPPKQGLFNFDCVQEGGRVAVAVEGPFDALKLDLFGRGFGVRAVALSTNSLSSQQIDLLGEVWEMFGRLIIMHDQAKGLGALDSMRLQAQLSHLPGVEFTAPPFNLKDAGEMSPGQVVEWCAILESQP